MNINEIAQISKNEDILFKRPKYDEYMKFQDEVLFWESGLKVQIGQTALIADDWHIKDEFKPISIFDIEVAIQDAWHLEEMTEFTNEVLKLLEFKGRI